MKLEKRSSNLIFLSYLGVFTLVSLLLFLNVYDKSGYVIDEIFHIPQGEQYCQYNFSTWNPKITTLPGLYLVSAAIWGTIGWCTYFWLRATNLIAAIINVYLFKVLFHLEQNGTGQNKAIYWSSLLASINLGMLPPLYFFSHLYYTDTLSVTFVLLTVICAKKDKHLIAAFTGAFSVVMRQTNIIWVTMIMGQYFIHIIMGVMTKKTKRSKRNFDFWDVYNCLRSVSKKGFKFPNKLSNFEILSVFQYNLVMIAFCLFVFINGSIVVGDKNAHTATIHIPQIFYFLLFCTVFAIPHFCLEIKSFLNYCTRKKFLCLILLCLSAVCVHFNTLVHPYLLADNRHYTFYIWNRLYGKFTWARYVIIPLYIFAMYALLKRVEPIKNFIFLFTFIPSTILVLVLQRMIDVRYFLIPFILIRLKFKPSHIFVLIAETILYLCINFITFYIFFTKDIYWTDFTDAQKLMW